MKAEIVEEDEREQGRRALLNLGHTFGHALETELGFGEALLHGEAVALGCTMAFRFSASLGLAPAADARRVEAALAAAGLAVRLAQIKNSRFKADALLGHMAQDKKGRRRPADGLFSPAASARRSSPRDAIPRPCGIS